MIKKKSLSQEDIDTWKNYIKDPKDVSDKDDAQKDGQTNYHRFKYDLHGFTLLDANQKVKEIILSCVKKIIKKFYLSLEKAFILTQSKTFMLLKILAS